MGETLWLWHEKGFYFSVTFQHFRSNVRDIVVEEGGPAGTHPYVGRHWQAIRVVHPNRQDCIRQFIHWRSTPWSSYIRHEDR